jgi:enoyl-CoA hydratase/carnithine racemase
MSTWLLLKEWPALRLERMDGAGVARVVLNRPDKRNAIDAAMVAAWGEALELVRADRGLKAVITKGAGAAWSSGLDLHFLRAVSAGPPGDWDRPTPTIALAETLRRFPRVTIAQVHGYCLGGALGIMSMHDLVVAADDAQLGMPEILRGSFGQLVTSALVHGRIPLKKFALLQLGGENLSGAEAERVGLVSKSVPAAQLETASEDLARGIAARHLAALEHAKIAVQLGRDLSLAQAIEIDRLVGARLQQAMDPTANLGEYLSSQKGGPNPDYKRPDA